MIPYETCYQSILRSAFVLAACLALTVSACGSEENVEKSDASVSLDAGDTSDADAQVQEESDAAVAEKFDGCDLMEFAPEHRSNQGTASALINVKMHSLGYFQEISWFEGGETNGTWMLDAFRFNTQGQPFPLTIGTHQLSGNDLGNSEDCTLCIDLGRSNMDDAIDANFYPENVRIEVESADMQAGGSLKFTVSGIFREDADSSKRSWCINDFVVDAQVQQYCSTTSECPEALPFCGYPAGGSYPVCLPESATTDDKAP